MFKQKKNLFVLVFIIMIDFIGFTLIFPLVPDLLLYYLNHPIYKSDEVIIHFFLLIDRTFKQLIPFSNNLNGDVVLIVGGIISSIFSVLQFIFSPYWGKLSDLYGRKKILIYTNIGLGLSYLFWLFSKSFSMFLISRIIGGIMSGNLGVASAAMADMSNKENRTAYMGLVGMAFGLGFVIGPVFGGLLYYIGNEYLRDLLQNSFFHPFSICALGSFSLSLISILFNFFFLEETHQPSQKTTRERISIMQINQLNTPVKLGILLNLVYMLIFTSYEFTFTFFYKFTFNLTPKEIGFVFLYLGLLIAIGQGSLSRMLSGKISEKTMMQLGIVSISTTFLLQPILKQNIFFSLLTLIPLALGNSLFQPAVNGYTSLHSKKEEQGYVLGLMRSLGSLSRAIGPFIGGSLYWMFGIQISYLIFIFILLIALYLTFRL
jgi:MFS family permease